ncbi:AMP-binding protein [Chloroflexota bacterium]
MLLNRFLEDSADRYTDKEALVCQGQRLCYAEIEGQANALGNALVAGGLRRQDRAAVYLDNSVESVVSIFGILKAGGVFLVVNPQVKARKLGYILDDCQARVLITDNKHFKRVSEVISRCPNLESVILTDSVDSGMPEGYRLGPRILSYRRLLEQSPTTRPPKRCIDIDLASLIYTSGSTGNPKGVMLTHLNMVSAANSITQYLENTGDDIIIDVLPLSFDYGLYQVLMAFKFGGKVVLEKAFVYPYQIIDLVIKEKVTGWPMVPAMAAILLRLKNLDEYDFSKLRYITNTAQTLPPKHIFRLIELFPDTQIYSMYGLTECKRVSYLPPQELAERPTSVGKAMPNTEVYIVGERGERITAPRTAGELVVRGASVMRGYWNLPLETDNALRPGPYPGEKVLYSGDIFETDEEGYLYFLGRRDNIIKTAGERVSPREVEAVLCEREDVVEAVVCGVEDELLGMAIKAFVVLTEDAETSDKEIIRFCSERLEDFMVPKYVEFLSSLPKTSTGKISVANIK